MADPPDAIDTESLAEQVVAELDPGTVVDNKLVLSRRQVIALAGSGLGAGALATWASGEAAAADGTQDTSDGTVRGNGGGVDVRLDELLDPGGDEVVDIDDTGAVNVQHGRPWWFDQIGNASNRATVYGDTIDGNSVKADDLGIGDHPNITGIESDGFANNTTISGSADDGWETFNSDTITVTFDTEFDSVPQVFVDVDKQLSIRGFVLQAHPVNVSTTSFDIEIFNYGTEDSTDQQGYWIAVEQ